MVYDPADRLGSFERVAALARTSSGAPATRWLRDDPDAFMIDPAYW